MDLSTKKTLDIIFDGDGERPFPRVPAVPHLHQLISSRSRIEESIIRSRERIRSGPFVFAVVWWWKKPYGGEKVSRGSRRKALLSASKSTSSRNVIVGAAV
jgi:hypothetical protein